jgi:putative ABC transport system substrate-binding protein
MLIGGTAAAWPLAANAQQQARLVIGFLNGQSAHTFTHLLDAFHRGLNESGYVEGRNVTIEYRWADGQSDRLPALAEDLVRRAVDLIVATGGSHWIAKAATRTIPIVSTMGDPTREGFAASVNRPGGNVTGASIFNEALEAKRFEIVQELVSKSALVGVLIDPRFSEAETQLQQVTGAARSMGREVLARTERDIETAFDTFANRRAGAVVVTANPFFNSKRAHVAALALRHRIASIFEFREATSAGGLMSYGPSVPEVYRQVGLYAGRVLRGEKPSDLPIMQPTKFDLIVNLKTAKALGLTVPDTLLARADEVIE